MSRANTRRDFKPASSRRGDGNRKRKQSQAQGPAIGELLPLLQDIRSDVRKLCRFVMTSPQGQLMVANWKRKARENLYCAIYSYFATASFTAAQLLAAADGSSEEATRLKQALRAVLPVETIDPHELSRFLGDGRGPIGAWSLEIDKDHTNTGRSYCLVRVTGE